MIKKENGITLIALVITIIVLLILAAVTIAMLTSDNGILNKANTAVTNNRDAEAKEALSLAVDEALANKLEKGNEKILASDINNAKVNSNVSISATGPVEGSEDISVTVTFTGNNGKNYSCKVDERTGEITEWTTTE